MLKILYVGLGGFLGSISRYLLQLAFPHPPVIFPWGTFVANILGCLIIGIIYGLAENNKIMTHESRLFFAVGFCGSFTTFSTFASENLNLLQLGQYWIPVLNIVASVLLGLAAVYLGIFLVRF